MVVTRFPPSPTGYLHVGGLRTALYAYLFARQNKGRILLRIEDTDQKREVEGAEENLIRTLAWADLEFDEGPHVGGPHGPYRQSERLEHYQFFAAELVKKDKAYLCFCTAERLENLRKKQEASKLPTMYDGYCRALTKGEIAEKLKAGASHVIRLKVPKDELVIFDDVVRGRVKVATRTIDDQVLLKSDGFPTYHLANVVDDHLMEVTHVIRGEEWLPSTPKHILLYQSFDWMLPIFAHLPLILNPDRSKLSKRQGDVAVEDYMKKGFEKEELLNFIAFLGWNPGGTREIYSKEEMVEVFDLTKVQKAGAVFNPEKLHWFRGVWRQRKLKQKAEELKIPLKVQETKQGGFAMSIEEDAHRLRFAQLLLPWVKAFLPEQYEKNPEFLLRALYIVKDKVIQDPEKVEEFIGCYFSPPALQVSLLLNEKMSVDVALAASVLKDTISTLSDLSSWKESDLREALTALIQKKGLKNGQVLWPIRVAMTRSEFSPGAFESAWVLGKDKTIQLLQETRNLL